MIYIQFSPRPSVTWFLSLGGCGEPAGGVALISQEQLLWRSRQPESESVHTDSSQRKARCPVKGTGQSTRNTDA